MYTELTNYYPVPLPDSQIKVTHRSYEQTQIHRSTQQGCGAARRGHMISLINYKYAFEDDSSASAQTFEAKDSGLGRKAVMATETG